MAAGGTSGGLPGAAPDPLTMPYSWIRGALDGGAAIVTANRRLARELRTAYERQQLEAGMKSWRTPRIVSLEPWLNSLLEAADASVPMPLRLDAQASTILWERCIGNAAPLVTLNQGALVRQARQTWQRLNEWRVPIEDLHRFAGNDDEQLFAAAAERYRGELTSRNWIDGALLPSVVAARLNEGRIVAPERIVFAGFDRLTPALRVVVNALEENGCRVETALPPERPPAPRIVASADGDAELRAAGAWARQQLASDERARVAIVYPGLEHDAARALRLVREGFAPGWQIGGGRYLTAVHVSYGRRLSEYPLIAVALLWLQWTHRGLKSREVSILLRTPLIGAGATDGCCRLELELRRLPDRAWSAASLAAALRDRDTSEETLAWLTRVDTIAASSFGNASAEMPSAWAARIDRLLAEIGWPGERQRGSVEFQLINRWRELLNEFSRIETVKPRLMFAEAVSRLAAAAADTVYQPETAPGRVQLLGTLEAAGLAFDHVWIGNLHALQWPPPSHPLALVSRRLQRQAGMPDATPADTLEFSRRTLARLVVSAPSVVLSWPRADRESELAPSPLLEPYARQPVQSFNDPGWFASSLCTPEGVERVRKDPVPAVRLDEKVRGGAYTVQRQVTDPISAFAYGRLGVSDLQSIETGLSARTCGSIVHAVLHGLMMDQPAAADIRGWSATERKTRIERAINSALAPHERHADGVLRRLLALERLRLRRVMQQFVQAEIDRPDFFVDSVEAKLRYVSHGVGLDLRVDRTDRLADGSLLIVDYKTGAVKNLLNRAGDPADLQLVVYAAALDCPIGGLVLINIAGSGIRYKGIGSSVAWNRLAPEPWQERLTSWRTLVDEALAQLSEGDVRINIVQPTDGSRPLNVLSRAEELKRVL